ncbi:MAG TPA: glutamate synthase large subunit [Candidatus Sulfotelmatobacter sp.]|nr:glutamate synthase large subunit [Candidatus Sulfotelmatobacter sp.]
MYRRPNRTSKPLHPNWGHPDRDACGTGFIAQLSGPPTHEILTYSLQALERLSHRGGVDADGASGDGAGLLTSLPVDFFRARAAEDHVSLDELFGVGMLFALPTRVADARTAIEDSIGRSKLRLVGWRRVPTNSNSLGQRALETMPEIWQFFIEPSSARNSVPGFAEKFERSLALLRKRAERVLPERCYICSLSSRTIVYKGLLTPWQFPRFYQDLRSSEFAARFAIFHQRYSTNTEPSWQLAQPFRYVAHNGEINTIISNRRWLRAREREVRKRIGVGKWFQLLEENVSDSASFDNALELKLLEGKSVEAAMLALVPPAFAQDPFLSPDVRAALEALSREGEPWDGPAALVFSNGLSVGVKLDRNGLRPMRYTVTHDGLVIAGSETGLLDLEESRIAERHRLGPGEILLATPHNGNLLRWRELLKSVTAEIPRKTITRSSIFRLETSVDRPAIPHPKRVAAAAGWSDDQYKILFRPLLAGKEADWSMGDDAPPAFLSMIHRPLWDYCKQRFAQVTNPPIDPLRESHVMSLEVPLGHGHFLASPILTAAELDSLCAELAPVHTIDFTFSSTLGVSGARRCLTQCKTTPLSSGDRPRLLLLSDRSIGPDRAALPALLAAASAWKSLLAQGLADIPLVVESAQVFETHHVAMLVAAGASAVIPYLAEEFAESEDAGAFDKVRKGMLAGLRKVLARMGISTLASYRNSHLFELLGLDEDICREYFEDAACYPGTKTLDALLKDYLQMHAAGYGAATEDLADHGLYRFRKGAELHATSPELVRRMHAHVRKPEPGNYNAFEQLAKNDGGPTFLRDLLEMLPEQPVPLAEVESLESILARFSTQAMSLGSLSPEAHKTLSVAMNQLGGRSNTGEGGEDPELYNTPGSSNKVKQVASGRFGVTAEYLVRAEELEIKMAQGSKPGEGGQLPARKVTEYIARIRHATPGTPLISPPPHHDIYSIEDLAQLIHDLRAVNPKARIGVKLVSGTGVGVIAAGVAKAGADVITISGHNGGTGSSPLTSIKNTGLPWEIGLRETHETLLRAGLRSRVNLRVDGGLRFSRDILIAATLGADEFGFGTAALVAIGCVMARQCHLNTCPVGIATQDETLRTRFNGKPEMVVTYFRSLAEEIRNGLSQLGVRTLTELRGWYDRLETHSGLDALLVIPVSKPRRVLPQQTSVLDGVVEETELSFEHTKLPGTGSPTIHNFHRSIGAHFSGERMSHRLQHLDLPSATREFRGTAGQSFGAFLSSGLTLKLSGEANDYVGKGLSGGTIVIRAGHNASKRGDVLVGNTVLYGATSGQLFVAGQAGERFAVRNSGAVAVVEGVGQHGCEYMTGGIVAVLGPIGLNFGSGMTGGLAYILRSELDHVLNLEFVQAHEVDAVEESSLRRLLEGHVALTDSPLARRLLQRRINMPLVRVQPIHFQGTVQAAWKAVPGVVLDAVAVDAPNFLPLSESAAPHYA